MKERPILFNTEMVKAILSGQKTQTRRALKTKTIELLNAAIKAGETETFTSDMKYTNSFCPYGKVGDRLWVRETTKADYETADGLILSQFVADNEPVVYIGCEDPEFNNTIAHWDYPRDTKPNIHMPRWACRLVLEITDVRVERLNDISEADTKAEGVASSNEFENLWQSINGEASWDDNPWVWVIEFKVVEGA